MLSNEALELANARAEQDPAAEPLPEDGQTLIISAAPLPAGSPLSFEAQAEQVWEEDGGAVVEEPSDGESEDHYLWDDLQISCPSGDMTAALIAEVMELSNG